MTTPTDTAAVEAMIERLKGYANHDPQTSWRSQCERDAIAILAALAEERDAAEAEVAALRVALADHNDALRSACAVAHRNGAETNWLSLRGQIHWVLAEHHELTNEARAALKENPDGL